MDTGAPDELATTVFDICVIAAMIAFIVLIAGFFLAPPVMAACEMVVRAREKWGSRRAGREQRGAKRVLDAND